MYNELTDVIIYTKDRACQLDLLLRSIKDNFMNTHKISILEDWSNEEFKHGYDKIKSTEYGLELEFIKQDRGIFYNVLKQTAEASTTEHILPLCDDDVFIRHTDITDVSKYVDADVVGIHFRFSSDLTISYHHGVVLPQPDFIYIGDYLKWNWTTYNIPGRWGYPYQAGGMVYKTEFLRHMIHNIKFDLPNYLESAMMTNRYKWNKQHIVAFKHSPIVNISINRVQQDVPNRGGRDVNYTPVELNNIFLSEKIIDTADLYGMVNNCEFIEVPLKFMEDTR